MKEIRRNILGMTIFAIYSLVAFIFMLFLFARDDYVKDYAIIRFFSTTSAMCMGFIVGYGLRTMVLIKKFQEK